MRTKKTVIFPLLPRNLKADVYKRQSLFSGTGETPEFPSYTDPIMETSIIEDETPLASQPKTTVKTTSSTKTTRKTVKLKKASKKSYTKKLKTKTKVKMCIRDRQLSIRAAKRLSHGIGCCQGFQMEQQ